MHAATLVLLKTKISVIAYSLIVLVAVSWLSLTALGLIDSILWLYEGVLGVSEGLVISARGFSPLTTLVYKSEVEGRISNISGITVEYYLATPVLYGDRVLVLRSTNSSTISGDCVLVGWDLARELGVKAGEGILVSSFFTSEVYYLKVCGYTSGYVLEAPYDLVARIRGVGRGYYSYAVVKGPSSALSRVMEALGVKPEEYKLTGLIVTVLSRISSNETRAVVYSAITEAYIANFGLQRDYILYFACGVAVASVVGSIVLGLDNARRFKNTLRVFRMLGASRRSITTSIILLGFTVAILACAISLVIYNYVRAFNLEIMGYVLEPRTHSVLVLLVFTALITLYTTGLTIGVRCEVE